MEVIVDTTKGVYREQIVRCKDCVHWDKNVDGHINVDDHLCRRIMRWTMETDYCSCGERKEGK